MNPTERHRLVMDLFDEACDLAPDERTAFLEEQCAGDPALRAEVESMLGYDGAHDEVMDAAESGRGVDVLAADLFSEAEQADLPDRIGRYEIVREIGRGGMGIVYEARQDNPRRRVALKVIRQGFASNQLRRRFEHEVHVLGLLDHPGIAHIYEAGSATIGHSSWPYFAMEFIDGRPIDAHVRNRGLSTRETIELVARLCDAVQHAHQKGVIHRDLKPGNVLVKETITSAEGDGESSLTDTIGQPKVLDFGIARATDADLAVTTMQTNVGQIVGTIAYMSPEQLDGNSEQLDTRCDVYAIGVILYQLLAGKAPLDLGGKPVAEAARIVRDQEPARLGSVNPVFRGDIETIVAKAMEKDRARRYASASGLAEDLRRYLRSEPISAHPPSRMYQARKFARRNKALVCGVAATFVVLVGGLIATGAGLTEAQRQRDAAREAGARLEKVVGFQAAMLKGIDAEAMGRRIASDIRTEARANLPQGGSTSEQLDSLDRTLSVVNLTTIANRAIDDSIMTRAVRALDEQFGDQPLLRADLRESIVEIYDAIGLPEKSIEQARTELVTKSEALGADHPETLAVRQTICGLLIKLGEFEEAEREARELVESRARVLGPEHIDTLASQRLLGVALTEQSRFDEGEPLLLETLGALTRVAGDEHPETLGARSALGGHYYEQRSYDRAMQMYEQVYKARLSILGSDDDETLAALSQIASVHFLLFQYDEAAERFAQISETLAATLGDDHPETLRARHNMAINLTQQARYDEAGPIIRDTLERTRRVLGPDHPDTVNALGAALRLALRLQQWDESEAYAAEALAIAERTLGADNTRTLDARNDFASVAFKREDFVTAEQRARAALAEYERVLGPEHRRTLSMRQVLARVLMCTGQYGEAESHLRWIYEISKAQSPGSAIIAGALGRLTSTLIAAGSPEQAESAARELLEILESTNGMRPRVIGQGRVWVARTLLAQDRLEEARAMTRSAIDLMQDDDDGEIFWPLLYARLMAPVIDNRLGLSVEKLQALEAYQQLESVKSEMYTEVRIMLLDEGERMLRAIGCEPDTASPSESNPK